MGTSGVLARAARGIARCLRLLLALCAGLCAISAQAAGRSSEVIDRDWTFTPGNPVVRLAAHVNDVWNARVAPRAGEHVSSGGIDRNMRRVIADPVHVAWNAPS